MHQLPPLIIPSDLENLEDVQNFSEKIKEWANLEENNATAVSLALSEAVTNAIIHGNKENVKKKVNIQAKLSNNVLHILIEDEGEGFTPSRLPNPLAEENVLKISGRGVYLMNQFCDKVTYSDKGNLLTLTFNLDVAPKNSQ
ncbi:MAG: ATP-binding protein [Balneolales bacterium]